MIICLCIALFYYIYLEIVCMSLYFCNCLCICAFVFFLTLFYRRNWAEWVFRKRALCNHDKKELGSFFNLISLINSCPMSLPAASTKNHIMISRTLLVFPRLLFFRARNIDLRFKIPNVSNLTQKNAQLATFLANKWAWSMIYKYIWTNGHFFLHWNTNQKQQQL